MSSEPPEEPHLRSEPSILSPASPKPIHFPTPTNIPVLEMQMDVGFNQTEVHMNDPAMRNTELRPDAWRDPNELQPTEPAAADQPSPYSTGGDASRSGENVSSPPVETHAAATSEENVINHELADSNGNNADDSNHHADSISVPHDANPASPEQTAAIAPVQPSSDLSVPTVEASTLEPKSTHAYPQAAENPEEAQPQHHTIGTIDVQSMLDPTSTTMSDGADPAPTAMPPASDQIMSLTTKDASQGQETLPTALPVGAEHVASPTSASGGGLPPNSSGLPPRPPPQEQPLMHPNYMQSQHISDYHPHATSHETSDGPRNVSNSMSQNNVPFAHSPTSATPAAPLQSDSGYPGTLAIPSGGVHLPSGQSPQPRSADAALPSYPPIAASLHNAAFTSSPQNLYGMQYPSNTSTPIESRRERTIREGEQPRPEDRPWDAEVQRKYDRFIEEERRYVSEGRWEQFPQGSRLFVGNLSSEKVTKRDIFHVFHTYGELAQISIKQAYGFVQFLRTEDCVRAMQMEQGTQIRDKKIHLEVSKPQKNRTQNTQRRSRSPDNARARPGSNVDRYVSGPRGSNNRGSYGGYRSPSPRGYRERYDDRYRRRSRSPDYGRGGGRYRSPSPRRDNNPDDELPLPRRAPRDVPDVQIIVTGQLSPAFISWVEKEIANRGVRVDVLILSPRLSEQAVVRRQILEGVVAVIKLTLAAQDSSKIGLQIFDRSAGNNNVKFEEYEGLNPDVVPALVQRAKQQAAAASSYSSTASQHSGGGYGGYGAPPYNAGPPPPQQNQAYGGYGGYSGSPASASYPPPPGYGQPPPPPHHQPPPGVPPNLQNLITNLDPNNLQNLLSAMGSTPQSAASAPAYAGGPPPSLAALQNNPQLAGYLQHQQQQQQHAPGLPPQGQPGAGGPQVNMQDILARLGTGQR